MPRQSLTVRSAAAVLFVIGTACRSEADCTIGTFRCDGEALLTCVATSDEGNYWQRDSCYGDTECVAVPSELGAACLRKDPDCAVAPGDLREIHRCVGSALLRCTSTGYLIFGEHCVSCVAATATCTGGLGSPCVTDGDCLPLVYRCKSTPKGGICS